MMAKADAGVDLREHTLTVMISIADRMLYDAIFEDLAAAGFEDIRRAHGQVFEAIDPRGSRVTDMAERVHMTKQAMGQLVDHLEGGGYVTREPDPDDGRAKLVVLTKKGERVARTAIAATDRLERTWSRHLGERRAREFRRALEEICSTFGREHIR
jgi:DNA-binding MarR family transcriptional regulator